MSQCFVAAGGFLFTSVVSIVRPSAYANKTHIAAVGGRVVDSPYLIISLFLPKYQTDFDRHRQINRHATDDDAMFV